MRHEPNPRGIYVRNKTQHPCLITRGLCSGPLRFLLHFPARAEILFKSWPPLLSHSPHAQLHFLLPLTASFSSGLFRIMVTCWWIT